MATCERCGHDNVEEGNAAALALAGLPVVCPKCITLADRRLALDNAWYAIEDLRALSPDDPALRQIVPYLEQVEAAYAEYQERAMADMAWLDGVEL